MVFQIAEDHLGSLGRGAIAGPGFWNYDFALLRSINLGETGARLQFRAEFYNLFNHANLSVPISQYVLSMAHEPAVRPSLLRAESELFAIRRSASGEPVSANSVGNQDLVLTVLVTAGVRH